MNNFDMIQEILPYQNRSVNQAFRDTIIQNIIECLLPQLAQNARDDTHYYAQYTAYFEELVTLLKSPYDMEDISKFQRFSQLQSFQQMSAQVLQQQITKSVFVRIRNYLQKSMMIINHQSMEKLICPLITEIAFRAWDRQYLGLLKQIIFIVYRIYPDYQLWINQLKNRFIVEPGRPQLNSNLIVMIGIMDGMSMTANRTRFPMYLKVSIHIVPIIIQFLINIQQPQRYPDNILYSLELIGCICQNWIIFIEKFEPYLERQDIDSSLNLLNMIKDILTIDQNALRQASYEIDNRHSFKKVQNCIDKFYQIVYMFYEISNPKQAYERSRQEQIDHLIWFNQPAKQFLMYNMQIIITYYPQGLQSHPSNTKYYTKILKLFTLLLNKPKYISQIIDETYRQYISKKFIQIMIKWIPKIQEIQKINKDQMQEQQQSDNQYYMDDIIDYQEQSGFGVKKNNQENIKSAALQLWIGFVKYAQERQKRWRKKQKCFEQDNEQMSTKKIQVQKEGTRQYMMDSQSVHDIQKYIYYDLKQAYVKLIQFKQNQKQATNIITQIFQIIQQLLDLTQPRSQQQVMVGLQMFEAICKDSQLPCFRKNIDRQTISIYLKQCIIPRIFSNNTLKIRYKCLNILKACAKTFHKTRFIEQNLIALIKESLYDPYFKIQYMFLKMLPSLAINIHMKQAIQVTICKIYQHYAHYICKHINDNNCKNIIRSFNTLLQQFQSSWCTLGQQLTNIFGQILQQYIYSKSQQPNTINLINTLKICMTKCNDETIQIYIRPIAFNILDILLQYIFLITKKSNNNTNNNNELILYNKKNQQVQQSIQQLLSLLAQYIRSIPQFTQHHFKIYVTIYLILSDKSQQSFAFNMSCFRRQFYLNLNGQLFMIPLIQKIRPESQFILLELVNLMGCFITRQHIKLEQQVHNSKRINKIQENYQQLFVWQNNCKKAFESILNQGSIGKIIYEDLFHSAILSLLHNLRKKPDNISEQQQAAIIIKYINKNIKNLKEEEEYERTKEFFADKILQQIIKLYIASIKDYFYQYQRIPAPIFAKIWIFCSVHIARCAFLNKVKPHLLQQLKTIMNLMIYDNPNLAFQYFVQKPGYLSTSHLIDLLLDNIKYQIYAEYNNIQILLLLKIKVIGLSSLLTCKNLSPLLQMPEKVNQIFNRLSFLLMQIDTQKYDQLQLGCIFDIDKQKFDPQTINLYPHKIHLINQRQYLAKCLQTFILQNQLEYGKYLIQMSKIADCLADKEML